MIYVENTFPSPLTPTLPPYGNAQGRIQFADAQRIQKASVQSCSRWSGNLRHLSMSHVDVFDALEREKWTPYCGQDAKRRVVDTRC